MYVRSVRSTSNLSALKSGYLTDPDATLMQWLADNPNARQPNAAEDFLANYSALAARGNPNASAVNKPETVPLIPLSNASNVNEGVMCPQVMKNCPDGSLVGYDLKVKDRCVYLPCPSTAGGGSASTDGVLMPEFLKGPLESLYMMGPLAVYGVLGGGALLLAYMLFKK